MILSVYIADNLNIDLRDITSIEKLKKLLKDNKTMSIKDVKLAKIGKDEVNWAQRQMQVLEDIKLDFEKRKPLDGLNIGACGTLPKKPLI